MLTASATEGQWAKQLASHRHRGLLTSHPDLNVNTMQHGVERDQNQLRGQEVSLSPLVDLTFS
jgi:hypothetical protein